MFHVPVHHVRAHRLGRFSTEYQSRVEQKDGDRMREKKQRNRKRQLNMQLQNEQRCCRVFMF